VGANPLQDGLRIEPAPGPATLVIFGASGDLTKRKLLPALYHLSRGQRLPARLSVIGVGRSPLGDEGFRAQLDESLREFAGDNPSGEVASSLRSRLHYISGDLDDAALYRALGRQIEPARGDGVLYYLAVPPSAYPTIVEQLGRAGLARAAGQAWRRIVIEKPFGRDLTSATRLNQLIHEHFDEEQVFRIDHYLGKETVQNLLVFRFANGMFEPVWNRRYIDHVQITAAETVGVERRASYYEEAGALRDMVQNHLLELLTLVAMEPPTAFTARSVRDRKMDALLSVQPIAAGAERGAAHRPRPVRAGVGRRCVVPAYRAEPGVAPGSTTETFVAMRLDARQLALGRRAVLPADGQAAAEAVTEIAIQFRRPPLQIFKDVSPTPVAPNLLIVNVQPDEGISIRFEAKLPGSRMQLSPVMMNFRYGTAFGGGVPEAYETLLLDALLGDATLFARHDFVEAAWRLITPVHEAWRADGAPGWTPTRPGVGAGGGRCAVRRKRLADGGPYERDRPGTPVADRDRSPLSRRRPDAAAGRRGTAGRSRAHCHRRGHRAPCPAGGSGRRARGGVRRRRRACRADLLRRGPAPPRASWATPWRSTGCGRSSSTTPWARCACRASQRWSGGAVAAPRRCAPSRRLPTASSSTRRTRRRRGRRSRSWRSRPRSPTCAGHA
jgi:glucose-6-phosphate 1-dehydrogenase